MSFLVSKKSSRNLFPFFWGMSRSKPGVQEANGAANDAPGKRNVGGSRGQVNVRERSGT